MRDLIAEENRKIGGWNEGFDPFYGAPITICISKTKQLKSHNLTALGKKQP